MKSSIPTAREGHTIAVVYGSIDVCSGTFSDDDSATPNALAIVEEYNPAGYK